MAADRSRQDKPVSRGGTSDGRCSAAPRQSPRLLPPFKIWAIVAIAVGSIFLVRTTDLTADHAINNLLTLGLGFLAVMAWILWFSFCSGYSSRLRWLPMGVIVSCITFFFIFYRIDHFNGELIPQFAPRFSVPADQLLPQLLNQTPQNDLPTIDLSKSTAYDFPQFLGPQRRATVPAAGLSRDWTETAPRQLWKQPIGAGWSAFSAVNGYAVTMEQRGPLELVVCYDLKTGKVQWSHATKARYQHKLGGIGPRSTPTIHQGKVYALGITGQLHCFDGTDGKVLWKRDLQKEFGLSAKEDTKILYFGRSSSPLIVNDTVVVPAGGPQAGRHYSLAAYDKDTGELVWKNGTSQISYSSPSLVTLCGQKQILTVNENDVAGYDPNSGEEFWKHDWEGDNLANANISQAVAVEGDRVLVSKGYGTGAMLLQILHSPDSGWTTKKVWSRHNALRTKFTNVVIKDGYVYGLSDGIMQCVDLNTGRPKWKKGRYGHGQILLVGDVILVLSESGNVHLLEATPKKHTELTKFSAIEGKTWNNICLYGPFLLVRNAEQAACYELPQE